MTKTKTVIALLRVCTTEVAMFRSLLGDREIYFQNDLGNKWSFGVVFSGTDDFFDFMIAFTSIAASSVEIVHAKEEI